MLDNSISKIINSTKKSIYSNKKLLLRKFFLFHSNFMSIQTRSEIFSEFYNYCQLVTVVSEFLKKYGEYDNSEIQSILNSFIEAREKYFDHISLIVDNSSSVNLSYEKYELKIRDLLTNSQ